MGRGEEDGRTGGEEEQRGRGGKEREDRRGAEEVTRRRGQGEEAGQETADPTAMFGLKHAATAGSPAVAAGARVGNYLPAVAAGASVGTTHRECSHTKNMPPL